MDAKNLLVKTAYLDELKPLQKTYKIGDEGDEVIKIKEWLMLWQLDENYISALVDIKVHKEFNENTEKVVKEIQAFLDLPQSGEVDPATWTALTSPMSKAFSLAAYNHGTVRERMVYFAIKHLQYRSSELLADNMGPWVRAYMDGNEGTLEYWCEGFACTILDQTFSSFDIPFTKYYANTWACETMREHARETNLLVTNEQLQTKEYTPQTGDMVLYISDKDNKAHHTEIVYEVLDKEQGNFLTIGGNTNFSGSRNGVGVFLVDRNFLNKNVEIVKMIEQV